MGNQSNTVSFMYTDFDIYNYIVTVTTSGDDGSITKYYSPPAITINPDDIVEVVGIFRDTKKTTEILPLILPIGSKTTNSKIKSEIVNIFVVNDNTQPNIYLTSYLDVNQKPSTVNFQLSNTKDYYYLVKYDNSNSTNPQSINVMSGAIFIDAVRKYDNVIIDSTIESIDQGVNNLLITLVDSEIIVINY